MTTIRVMHEIPVSGRRCRPAAAWLAGLACLAGSASAATAATTAAPDDWLYPVRHGDTLIGIATQVLQRPQDWRALQRLNGVRQPRRLQVGSTLRIPLAWLRPQTRVAEVVDVTGPVSIEGTDGRRLAAVSGAILRPSDTLVTAAAGSAAIRFADGSRVLLLPNSRVTLQQSVVFQGTGSSAMRLDLHQGGAESQVRSQPPRPRFEIRTPVLDLGARGTDFRARFDPASLNGFGEVSSGSVAASREGSAATRLDAGFGIVGRPGQLGTAQPLLPAPDLSPLPERIERLPLRLEWTPMATALGWRAQVFEGHDGTRLLLDGRFEQPLAQFADLPDGPYRLRVRAVDSGGLEGVDSQRSFTLRARPEAPFLREPRPGDVRFGSSSRFLWTLSSAAASYRLQVATRADFVQPSHDLKDLPGPAHELSLAPGRWLWRLASVRADGDTGPWSDAQSFEIREPPGVPKAEAPQVDEGRVLLRWAAGRPGDRFEFQLARDPAFTGRVIEQRVDRAEVALDALEAGRYHVRSRTINAEGITGPWSAASEFEVPSSRNGWWLLPFVLLLWVL